MKTMDAKSQFDDALKHIIVAYRFFVHALPHEGLFASGEPVRVGKFEFQQYSQVEAMLVELGWAFFARLEGCLEALVHRLEIRGADVPRMIEESGEFSPHELNGLAEARDLRNIFHHGDGDWTLLSSKPRRVRPESGEPHLLPDHIEQFHKLFCKIADYIARPRLRAV